MNAGTIELPRWMGSFYSNIPRYRYPGLAWRELVDEQRKKLEAVGFRVVAKAEHRAALIVVSAPYYPIARLWMWWRRRRWILEELAVDIHLLRVPYEGAFYHEARFGPPDLWGEPLRKWEKWFV